MPAGLDDSDTGTLADTYSKTFANEQRRPLHPFC